jgi:hypothetical protein
VSIEGGPQGFTCQLPGAMTGHDHDIASRQLKLMQAEAFPADPFETIALHRIACGFNGDREPQAGMVQAVWAGQDHQTGVALTVTLCPQGSELACPGQASRWRETPLSHEDGSIRRSGDDGPWHAEP